jgi:chitinase
LALALIGGVSQATAEEGIYARNYQVSDVPAEKLTHLNYAFAQIVNNEIAVHDASAAQTNLNALRDLKVAHPHLKTLVSVGGWTLSAPFSNMADTPAERATFAASCVAFIRQWGLDGVDIDWEWPVTRNGKSADTQNFTLLLADLRAALDQASAEDGKAYLLTIAAPAGQWNYQHIELDRIHAHVDFINIMSYDYHGTWEGTTNFNAPLYAEDGQGSIDDTVQVYLAASVPPSKICIGLPFYGRGWDGVSDSDHSRPGTYPGLYQAGSTAPGEWEPGVYDYEYVRDVLVPDDGSTVHRHGVAMVPYVFNPSSGLFVTYDDPLTLGTKSDYVLAQGLRGVMFWELSGDTPESDLLNAIHAKLGGPNATQAPTGPTNLRVTGVTFDTIDLAWDHSSTPDDREDGFYVERSVDGGATYTQLEPPAGRDVTTYRDTGLDPSSSYRYRVYAFNDVGSSASSSSIEQTTALPPAPPSAPTDVAGSAVSDVQVNLGWADNATGEDGFHVQRALDDGAGAPAPGSPLWTPVATVGADQTAYADVGLTAETTYHYRVRAFSAAGGPSGFAYGDPAGITTLVGCPATIYPNAPTGLTGVAVSGTDVELAWLDNADNEDGFRVERVQAGGQIWEQVTLAPQAGVGAMAYRDVGLVPATNYYYRVAAFNCWAGGSALYSASVQVTTGSGPPPPPVTDPPEAPTALSAIATSSERIVLSWEQAAGGEAETGFHVYRSSGGSSFVRIATTNADVEAYADTGLAASTTYTYYATAVNEGGESDPTAQASATTDAPPPADHVASGETTATGTRSGSFADTHARDGSYEALSELSSKRKRQRYSQLEHRWTFDVGGDPLDFHCLAYRTASGDGDDFVFAYSTDGATYTDMLTVTKTSNDGVYQTYALPAAVEGTVYVRVRDTDRTLASSASLDTLFVDHLYFRSGGTLPPPPPDALAAPTGLQATPASSSQIQLSWSDPNATEDGGEIERSLDGQSWSPLAAVAADATSYTDAGLTPQTTYHYRVRATRGAEVSAWSNAAAVTTSSDTGDPTDAVAHDDHLTYGTQSGTLAATHHSDDIYQTITEKNTGGPRGYSRLEHSWTIEVTGGSAVTVFLEAHRSASPDGDDFVFAYSTDGSTFVDVLTLTQTTDTDAALAFDLPPSTQGPVTIRVRDTDRTRGNKSTDSLYVDYLFIRSR